MRKFRDSLKSKDRFVSDQKTELIKLYGVKLPVVTMASRTTFVIGPGRKVLAVVKGSDAIDPENSIKACTLTPASDARMRR